MANQFEIIDEDEFITMLHLFHDLGAVIYFGGDDRNRGDTSLRDIVILDPQWLIDVFKGVITVMPNADQVSQYFAFYNKLKFSSFPRIGKKL